LPAVTFAEKDGTFTNTERRVQRVRRAIEPIGAAKPDWQIICDVAQQMGATGFDFANPEEIFAEITALTPSYHGISYSRLEHAGIQWPCPTSDHPGTQYLHAERFATANGKGKFVALKYKPSAELPSAEYPFILTTDRSLFHYHTATMTRKVPGLNVLHAGETVRINPKDAARLNIKTGDRVRVISRRGEVEAAAEVTSKSAQGEIAMTFHFAESLTNNVTSAALDPVSKIPETKVCAVKIVKVL
jgi:predicted molibdopterin-dependent oxidoreductase YjgC